MSARRPILTAESLKSMRWTRIGLTRAISGVNGRISIVAAQLACQACEQSSNVFDSARFTHQTNSPDLTG